MYEQNIKGKHKLVLFLGLGFISIFSLVLMGVRILEMSRLSNGNIQVPQGFSEIQKEGTSQQYGDVAKADFDHEGVSESVNQKKDKCILKRKLNNSSKIVFGSNCYGKIVRWKDYLFFPEMIQGKSGSGNIILFSYNIATGEKKEIYNLSDHKKDFPRSLPYDVDFLGIVEENLYFSLGGYMTDFAFYSLTLPSIESGIKLVTKDFSRIEYRDGRYWLLKRFGDACVGSETRAIFTVGTQKIGKEFTVQQECNEGERFIGAADEKVYVQRYIQQNISAMEMDGISIPKIQEIYSMNIDTLRKKVVVFDGKSSSEIVSDALYLYNKKKFLFVTNDMLAFYNAENSRLEKITDIESASSDIRLRQVGDKICLDWSDEIDLENKKVIKDQKDCQQADSDGLIPEQIKQLNLPEEYFMEMTY